MNAQALANLDQTPVNLLAAATIIRTPANRSDHELVIRQKPQVAKVFVGKEKDRKPIDPPPIIQLRISESIDPNQNYLQSPYFFISCSLLDDDENQTEAEREEVKSALAGTLVSSLHRLKDTDNNDGGFFVFGDLSVKMEGIFRLQFSLYEVHDKEVQFIRSIQSDNFKVYASKNWPDMAESTFLTRSFSDQGVRLRLRKEPRFRLGPRGPASDDYQPRHYNRGQGQSRRPSLADFSQSPHPMHSKQGYVPAPRNVQGEYPAPHSSQQPHLQGTFMHETPRKREREHSHSHSSQSGSYDGSHYGATEEPNLKRTRSEASASSEQPLHGQPYVLQSALQYGSRQYSEATTASFTSFAQQIQQPQQTYSSYSPSSQAEPSQGPQTYGSYGQNSQHAPPQLSSSFPPRRLDTSFSSPAVTLGYDSPTAVRSAMSSTSQTQLFHRSPASAVAQTPSFGFPLPVQQHQPSYMPQPQQMAHGNHSQPQYTTQLQQPLSQSRAVATSLGGMNIYGNDGGAESRPGLVSLNEMPPPLFSAGRGMGSTMGIDTMPGAAPVPPLMGMSMPHPDAPSGSAQLPSPGGGGARAWGGGIDQYGRPRDDHGR